MIKNIYNEDELLNFIKERYGEGCDEYKKNENRQTGVFDIGIKKKGEPGDDKPEDLCWINWITILKYYPEKNIIASWDVGQEYTIYDFIMLETFLFL